MGDGGSLQKTEVKLLDCPFCGQADNCDSIRMEDDSLDHHPSGYFWIQCHSCGARGPEERSQEKSISSWQREPVHFAGEELAQCPQCAGTGRWFKTEEQKQAENETPPYWCELHGTKGHTANSPMCEQITRDDMREAEASSERPAMAASSSESPSSQRPAKHQSHCRASGGFTCSCVKSPSISEPFLEESK